MAKNADCSAACPRVHNGQVKIGPTSPLRNLAPGSRPATPKQPTRGDVFVASSPAEVKRVPPSGPTTWALAAMGLGVLAALPQVAQAQVAVVDNFSHPQSHGHLVEAVLKKQGALEVVRVPHAISEDASAFVFAESQAEFDDLFLDFLQQKPADALKDVTRRLEGLMDQDVDTVNLSLSVSKAGRFQVLQRLALEDESLRTLMEKAVGGGGKDFEARLLARVEALFDSSQPLKQARKGYENVLARLEKKGVVVVAATGNEGELQQQLQARGIHPSRSFFDNLFDGPTVVGVGATHQGQVWAESNPGADVLAPGVGIRVKLKGQQHVLEGTSFAVPNVAEQAHRLHQQRPELSPAQRRALLIHSR